MKNTKKPAPTRMRAARIAIALLCATLSFPISPAQAEPYKRGVTLKCTLKSTHKKGAIPKEIVVGVTSYDSVIVSDEMTRNLGGPVSGKIESNRADTLVARWHLVEAKPGGRAVMSQPDYRFVVYKKDLTATLEATGQSMHSDLNTRTHLGRGSCKAIKDPRVLAKLQQDARIAKTRRQGGNSDKGCVKRGADLGPTSSQDGPSSDRWCP